MKIFTLPGKNILFYSLFDIQRQLGSEFHHFLAFYGKAQTYKTEDHDCLIPCNDYNRFLSKHKKSRLGTATSFTIV